LRAYDPSTCPPDKPEWFKRQIGAGRRKPLKYRVRVRKDVDENELGKLAPGGATLYPELAGRSFGSGLERRRAQELVLLQRAGKITELAFQKTVSLSAAAVKWRLDFYYMESGRPVYEDTKSRISRSEAFGIKVRLWRYYGPALLRLSEDRRGRVETVQEIMPRGCNE